MVDRRRKQTHSHKTAARKATRKTSRTRAGRPGSVRKKASAKKSAAKPSPRRWSQRVTQESDALDLRHGVFKLTDPKKIADALRTMEYKGVCETYKADAGQGLHHSTYVDQFNADGVAQSKKKVEVPAS